jgi:hypothetical protein
MEGAPVFDRVQDGHQLATRRRARARLRQPASGSFKVATRQRGVGQLARHVAFQR